MYLETAFWYVTLTGLELPAQDGLKSQRSACLCCAGICRAVPPYPAVAWMDFDITNAKASTASSHTNHGRPLSQEAQSTEEAGRAMAHTSHHSSNFHLDSTGAIFISVFRMDKIPWKQSKFTLQHTKFSFSAPCFSPRPGLATSTLAALKKFKK